MAPVPAVAASNRVVATDGGDPVESASRKVDFSRITPRQLQAYLDDMIAKDQIDPDDAVAMFGSIPGRWYTERPDAPIDFDSNIKAIADFNRNNGYPAIAVWYDGLSERMKLMEARSAPISVIA
jgi:hypothetical protein